MDQSYLHTLDPIALHIYGKYAVRWYGLSYAAGFLITWLFARWFARTNRSPIPTERVGDLMTFIILGVLLGGRIGYAVFYDHSLFGFRPVFPWWSMLAVGDGGMASHGGMIGLILAVWWWARRHRVSSLHIMDLGAFSCCAGLFLGRLANFVNGELWGKPLKGDLAANPPWWSVKYPEEIGSWSAEKLAALRLQLPQFGGDKTFVEQVVGAIDAGNQAVIDAVKPMLTAFYPSQIIQAVMEGPILMGVLAIVWWKPRRPGVVGACFLMTYGVLRIVSEIWRQPDEGVDVWLGLSRGQWLSVLMVVAGIIGLAIVARRPVERIGGLRKPVAE